MFLLQGLGMPFNIALKVYCYCVHMYVFMCMYACVYSVCTKTLHGIKTVNDLCCLLDTAMCE